MVFRFALAATVGALLLAWPTWGAAEDDAVAYVQIQDVDDGSILNEGSGFLIEMSGHILTAAHLFWDTGRPMNKVRALVHFGGREGRQRRAQVVECGSENIDVCLIKVHSDAAATDGVSQPLTPVCRPLVIEEEVVSKGFPPGQDTPLNTVPGTISGDLGAFLKYQTTLPIQPGMSGGPVFDAERVVVAINTGQAEGLPNFTFVQALSYSIDLIQKAGVECRVSQASVADEYCPDLTVSIPAEDIAVFVENNENEGKVFRWVNAMPGCYIGEVKSISVGPGGRPTLNWESSDEGIDIFVSSETFDIAGPLAPMIVSVQQWPIGQ